VLPEGPQLPNGRVLGNNREAPTLLFAPRKIA